jgi:plasmid maintenance system antidote protein VapI
MFAVCAHEIGFAPRRLKNMGLAFPFAICKVVRMSPTELSAAAGISVPFASQILSGKRKPSRPMAVQIFRRTGQKFGPLSNLTDREIDQLERLDAKAA